MLWVVLQGLAQGVASAFGGGRQAAPSCPAPSSHPSRTMGCGSLPAAGSSSQSWKENTRWQVEAMSGDLAASPAPEQGRVGSLMARRVVLALQAGFLRWDRCRNLPALSSHASSRNFFRTLPLRPLGL